LMYPLFLRTAVIGVRIVYFEEIEKKLYCDDVTLMNYIYSW